MSEAPGSGAAGAGADWTADLQAELRRFAADRSWQPFHTPRSLALALVGEVGELTALLQWRSDEEIIGLVGRNRQDLEDEVADILIYLLQFATALDLDLRAACETKMHKNAAKYPPPAKEPE